MLLAAGCSSGTTAAPTTVATATTQATTTTAVTTTTIIAGDVGVTASGSTASGGVTHIEMSKALTVPGHTLEIGTVVATSQTGQAVVLVLVHLDATLVAAHADL